MPKVSQGATNMHKQIDLRKRSRKGEHPILRDDQFGEPFPSKIDEQTDAESDAEKIMKIEEDDAKPDLHFDNFRN